MVAALATSSIVVRLVPELEGASMWAVAFTVPCGLIVGGLMAAFLARRGRTVPTFGRMVLETIAVTAVLAGGVSQLVIPVAWDLPRVTITIVIIISAVVLAGVASWLLKPLYWHVK